MASPNGAPVVVARGIGRIYGAGDTAVAALRDVDVDIPIGQMTAVMGPSGSGKSTLMHILAGLDQPTTGSVRIDGTEITDFQQLPEIISVAGGSPLAIGIHRGNRDMVLWVTPRLMKARDVLGNAGRQMVIGVRPDIHAQVTHENYGPVGAFVAASSESWNIIKTTILGIAQMIEGHASTDQLRGPVGIANMTRQVADFGFLPLLNLVAILSVSIGLANLFPIPLLDGGHLLYYGCEAVLGRPLGARAQDVGFRLGLVLVLGLMLLTTWNDLVRLNLF